MKQLNICIVLLILFASCNKTKTDGYYIEGKAEGVYNGIRANLKSPTAQRGRVSNLEKAIIIDGKFVFNGKKHAPGLYTLSIDNIKGNFQFILDYDTYEIIINKDNISKSEVKGSKANDLFRSFNNAILEKSKDLRTLNTTFRTASLQQDEEKRKQAREDIKKVQEDIENYSYQFIEDHKNSITSLVILERQSQNRNINADRFIKSFEQLDSKLKQSALGLKVFTKVKKLLDDKKKTEKLEIGKKAPEFSAPDVNGENLALKDVLGKVTIIDFWASWCGPCRKENPNVVKLYNTYKSKGLEILGVSLDSKAQKEKWLKAIDDDKLTWKQVSHLNRFNDPVAKLYNVSAIPATYILDENGIIIAKNLRGKALETKIAELLN